jgi:hypothetical protein
VALSLLGPLHRISPGALLAVLRSLGNGRNHFMRLA